MTPILGRSRRPYRALRAGGHVTLFDSRAAASGRLRSPRPCFRHFEAGGPLSRALRRRRPCQALRAGDRVRHFEAGDRVMAAFGRRRRHGH